MCQCLTETSGVAREVLLFTLPNSNGADGIWTCCLPVLVELESVLDVECCLTRMEWKWFVRTQRQGPRWVLLAHLNCCLASEVLFRGACPIELARTDKIVVTACMVAGAVHSLAALCMWGLCRGRLVMPSFSSSETGLCNPGQGEVQNT